MVVAGRFPAGVGFASDDGDEHFFGFGAGRFWPGPGVEGFAGGSGFLADQVAFFCFQKVEGVEGLLGGMFVLEVDFSQFDHFGTRG